MQRLQDDLVVSGLLDHVADQLNGIIMHNDWGNRQHHKTGHHDAQVALTDASTALALLNNASWEHAHAAADAVVELAWEKLHTGHWQHVAPVRT